MRGEIVKRFKNDNFKKIKTKLKKNRAKYRSGRNVDEKTGKLNRK